MEGQEDLRARRVEVAQPSPVFVLEEDWEFAYVNEDAQEIFEMDRSKIEGETFWSQIPETMEDEYRQPFEHALEEGELAEFEVVCPVTDRMYRFEVYPCEDRISVHAEDIEERARHEESLRLRERSLRAAHEIVADTEKPPDETSRELLAMMRSVLDTETAVLSDVDRQEGRYRMLALDGAGSTVEEAGVEPLDAHPLCAEVVRSSETLALDDVPDQAPRVAAIGEDVGAYIGCPVRLDEEVVGTFCFHSSEPRGSAFTDWEITYVELFSDWVSAERKRGAGRTA